MKPYQVWILCLLNGLLVRKVWQCIYIVKISFSFFKFFLFQCVATFASGPDISVRLPPESLLFVDISKQEKKRRKQAKQNGKSIHIQCEQILPPTH